MYLLLSLRVQRYFIRCCCSAAVHFVLYLVFVSMPSFPSSVSHPHLLIGTEVVNSECPASLSAEGQGHLGVAHNKEVARARSTYVLYASCSPLPVSQQGIMSDKFCQSAGTGKKNLLLSLKFLLHKLSEARTT